MVKIGDGVSATRRDKLGIICKPLFPLISTVCWHKNVAYSAYIWDNYRTPKTRQARRSQRAARLSLSKKWLAPLFRGFHSSLAPTARPGSYAGKPLLRKAFCGFDAHVAKSDYSLRGLRPPSPQGFLDKLRGRAKPGPFGPGRAQRARRRPPVRRSSRRRTACGPAGFPSVKGVPFAYREETDEAI